VATKSRSRKAKSRLKSAAERATAAGAALSSGALALGSLLGGAGAADAATFNVSNLNDSGAGSLRDAIDQANANLGPDVITFQAGLTGTITLTSGQLHLYDSVDIQGPGQAAIAVDGNNASRVFYVFNDNRLLDVTISGLTVQHGTASYGGGIIDFGENLTLDHVTVQNNTGGSGGGLNVTEGLDQGGQLTIKNSIFTGNSARRGGGIYFYDDDGPTLIQDTTIENNTASYAGGGVYFYTADYDVTIERCTISGNQAEFTGGGIYLYSTFGGKVTIRQTTISGNTVNGPGGGAAFYNPYDGIVVENSTISGNSAYDGEIGGFGGGIAAQVTRPNSYLLVRDSTVAGNYAERNGGGIALYGNGGVYNSIVAGNSVYYGNDPDILGSFFVLNHSLIQTPGPDSNGLDNGGNLFGQDPLLGPLQNNGGPTETMKPAFNSPVIDAGDQTLPPPPFPAQDQRLLPRVVGANVDMGAVELNPGTIQLTTNAASVAESAGSVTITATRTGGFDGAVSAGYTTADGTAKAPADYGAAAGVLNWADQDGAAKSFPVSIVNDTLIEGNETFTATLSNPLGGATLGSPTTETVTILDDDLPPIAAVPTLGDVGKVLFVGLLGAAAVLAIRKRKGAAVTVLIVSLALADAAVAGEAPAKRPAIGSLVRVKRASGSSPGAWGAAHGAKQVETGAVVGLNRAASTVTLRLADGSTLAVDLGHVVVKDRRRHVAQPIGKTALAPGQALAVKVRHAADGSISRVTISVFDTLAQAQAKAAKRHH